MSTADLFDETWPHTHGTPDGYDHGCKSGACPAGKQYGLSCKTARSLSRSDFKYQRMVRNGATVADVANEFGFVGTLNPAPEAPKKTRPTSKSTTPKEKKPVNKPTPATARGGRSLADTTTISVEGGVIPDESVRFGTPDPTPLMPTTEEASQRSRDIWEETAKMLGQTAALGMEKVTPETETEPAPNKEGDGETARVEPTTSEIRAWARDRGYEIGEKGRIPAHIRAHYDDAHRTGDPLPLAAQIAANLEQSAPEEPVLEDEALPEPEAITVEPEPEITPEPEEAAERPDWGHVALLEDLETAIAERDSARRWAVRLEQELASVTELLGTTTQQRNDARDEADSITKEYLDEFSKVIALEERLERRTTERDDAEKHLRIAQRATTLALTKWGEERQANEASYQVILGQAHTINTLTQQLAERPSTQNYIFPDEDYNPVTENTGEDTAQTVDDVIQITPMAPWWRR